MEKLNEIRKWFTETQLQYDQTLEIMEYADESKTEIHIKMVKPCTGFYDGYTDIQDGNVKTDFVLKVMNDYKNNPNSMTAKQHEDAWKLKIINNMRGK